MEFSTQLNALMRRAQCNLTQLSEASGVSQPTISRYRSGKRRPKLHGEHIDQLAAALAQLAEQNGAGPLYASDISKQLNQALEESLEAVRELNAEHFDELVAWMGASLAELAGKLSYDASTLSRIRSGKRRPSEPVAFANALAQLAVSRCCTAEELVRLAKLVGVEEKAGEGADPTAEGAPVTEPPATREGLAPAAEGAAAEYAARTEGAPAPAPSAAELAEQLVAWLLSPAAPPCEQVGELLSSIDDFNLDDYVKSIGYDTLKVPTAPFTIASSKNYCGAQGRMKAEIDFLKAVATNKGSKTFTMFCNMDMDELAEDAQFTKRFLFGMAAVLKRGVRIEAVHTVNRPLSELIAGLQGWIPLYMTGQVSSHCLETGASPFQHMLYSSEEAALVGRCATGNMGSGLLTLTSKRQEVDAVAAQAQALLKASKPLVETFLEDRRGAFEQEKARLLESGEPVYQLSSAKGLPFKNIQVTVVGSKAALISKGMQPRIDFIVRDARMCSALCAMAWSEEDASIWA